MLFQSLGPVIGAAGVRATFFRSLRLNKAKYPRLDEVLTSSHNAQDGEADVASRLTRCLSSTEPAEAAAIASDLYATFFDLMSNFIGEELLWQIVKRPPLEMDAIALEERD